MSGLKLTSVNKIYPSGASALHDINLEVHENELLVVTGGEESGKSTLLRVIAGLEDVSSGNIFIDGRDVTDEGTKERDVAMVFKNVSVDPSLTVAENLAYGLKIRKAPQSVIDVRVNAVANLLGLNEVLLRKPKALTAAAKQRIAIGRAIVREPELYLFDEPLSGMDENLRKDMLNVIASLQSRMKKPFVYATKNLSEALSVGTRIAVLKNGILQQVDTPINLYDYPANMYVAFFIGSPTINFIKNTKIVKEVGGYIAEYEGGKIVLTDKIVNRFKDIEVYAAEGKKVVLGIRPEDAADATNISKVQIFDGETRLALLSRDEGYIKTDFAEAEYVPLPYAEEQALIENLKPKKENTKNKK